MIIFLTILVLLVAFVWLFMRSRPFGRLPKGDSLSEIQGSPNYRDNQFQNQHHTPSLAEGVSMLKVIRKFFFSKNKNGKPPGRIPAIKTDLRLPGMFKNRLVWFGHSSYFIHADSRNILVDPVFSGHASPLSFTTNSYPGSDIYSAADLPEIDYLFITHDHWDHLDYKTVMQLKPKIKKIITGLGVAMHLESWGFEKGRIIERDWNQTIILEDGFIVNTAAARHFSGRTFTRNRSLWMSFVLQTPSFKLYLGGDSGYDTHFKEIGEKHGPFDLAILECGQYNEYWKYIHMMPEETVQAGIDLAATRILPVHWAKFSLSLSDWDDPIKRVTAEAAKKGVPLLHPMIGEEINLDNPAPGERWWEQVK